MEQEKISQKPQESMLFLLKHIKIQYELNFFTSFFKDRELEDDY